MLHARDTVRRRLALKLQKGDVDTTSAIKSGMRRKIAAAAAVVVVDVLVAGCDAGESDIVVEIV